MIAIFILQEGFILPSIFFDAFGFSEQLKEEFLNRIHTMESPMLGHSQEILLKGNKEQMLFFLLPAAEIKPCYIRSCDVFCEGIVLCSPAGKYVRGHRR